MTITTAVADDLVCTLADKSDIADARSSFKKLVIGRSIYGDSLYVHYKRGKVLELTPKDDAILSVKYMISRNGCMWSDKTKSNPGDIPISALRSLLRKAV